MTHTANNTDLSPPFMDVALVRDAALRDRLVSAHRALFEALDGGPPIALDPFESELDVLTRELARALGLDWSIHATLEQWRALARARFTRPARPTSAASADSDTGRPPEPRSWMSFFALNSNSFRFAASLVPEAQQRRIAGVYAWCRFTDELVDHAIGGDVEAKLDEWLAASRAAYAGETTGVALLDDVMRRTHDDGVSFDYAAELIAGMRMDLRHRDYADDTELSLYTWRAAGTVGRWLAAMHGVRDPWSLERAAALGQAMQLTNIVRDVGEDLERGRLYIPLDRLHAHGLSRAVLMTSLRSGRLPSHGWRDLLEGMMADADRRYEFAWEGLVRLPDPFRRAAAAAAAVYRGIHDAIRRIGYNVLRERAVTSTQEKVLFAAGALRRLDDHGRVERLRRAKLPALTAFDA